MTRELKLAMVIGFALLLMLAIVVSDHFSTGAADHSTLVASAQPRLADTPPPVALRGTTGSTEPLASGGTTARPNPAPRTLPIDATLSARTPTRPPVRPANRTADRLGEQSRSTSDATPVAPPSAAPVRPIPAASNRPDAIADPGADPTPRTYRVGEGDSLSSIANAFYGDPGLWNKLAVANRDRLPNPDRMRVGLLLVIPDREVLDGSSTATSVAAVVRDPLVADAPRVHVVGEGETLSEIAATHLGSARRWPEIVAANPDRIADPDRVQPGTELRLP